MIRKLVEKCREIKTRTAEFVMLVEREFGGKTGPEKKEKAISLLCAHVSLPFPLNCFKRPLFSLFVGKIVDRVCEVLNVLTDGDFSDVDADPAEVAVVADMPPEAMARAIRSVKAEEKELSVDERIEAMLKEYGIERSKAEVPTKEEKPIEPPAPVVDDRREDNWTRCVQIIGIAEGGANFDVVDGMAILKEKNRNDKGGPTKYGVTHGTLLSAYAKGTVGHKDIVKLTREEAQRIFRSMYCDPYGWLELPFEVCLAMLDATINHGIGGATIVAQRACNQLGADSRLVEDKAWGPKTKAAIWQLAGTDPETLAAALLFWRKDYFDRIIRTNPSQEVFRNGWYNRLRRIANEAGVASPV